MRKKNFWKKLLIFNLLVVFSIVMASCGNSPSTSADSEPEYTPEEFEEEMPEVGVEDEEGWTRIAPSGDKYEVIFSTDDTDIAAIVGGSILGKYYFEDVEFIVSKPVLPENLASALEQYKYKYVMVTQTGGEGTWMERNNENGGYALLICFPDALEVRGYDHNLGNGDGSGGEATNFEYVPNKGTGGEWRGIYYMSGYANTHDPVDLSDNESEMNQIISFLEKDNY